MRYIIAPLDLKEDEFKVYKYLWSKCDFKTMICEYTERNILIDIKADFSRKRLKNIFKMFIDINLFVILEKGTKGKPSRLFINKEVLWNQIGTELEPNRNQIGIESIEFEHNKEPNRNRIGTKKVPSIKEVKNKEKENNIYIEIIEYLNLKANTKYKVNTKKTISLIDCRLKEKFTLEDFKTVIDIKTNEWINNEDMCKYLRPETLFGNKFEGYLNQNKKIENKTYGWGVKKFE